MLKMWKNVHLRIDVTVIPTFMELLQGLTTLTKNLEKYTIHNKHYVSSLRIIAIRITIIIIISFWTHLSPNFSQFEKCPVYHQAKQVVTDGYNHSRARLPGFKF